MFVNRFILCIFRIIIINLLSYNHRLHINHSWFVHVYAFIIMRVRLCYRRRISEYIIIQSLFIFSIANYVPIQYSFEIRVNRKTVITPWRYFPDHDCVHAYFFRQALGEYQLPRGIRIKVIFTLVILLLLLLEIPKIGIIRNSQTIIFSLHRNNIHFIIAYTSGFQTGGSEYPRGVPWFFHKLPIALNCPSKKIVSVPWRFFEVYRIVKVWKPLAYTLIIIDTSISVRIGVCAHRNSYGII